MTALSKASALREALHGDAIVRAVGAHDGLGAKLVEDAGFDAIWASSFEASASRGVPDASLVTMTEYLDGAESLNLTRLPVVADCDTGFGGPMNVAYAVQRFESRGIAAVCIEDKLFPKINSFADHEHPLVPAKEFALKIQAGKDAQASEDFLLIARTEALVAGRGVEEALERAHTYADADADAILVQSKSERPDEVLEFAAAWDRPVPLIAVPTSYPQVTEQTLREAGFGMVIYANQALRAAVRSMRQMLNDLSTAGCAAAVEPSIASMSEIFRLQGMPARFGTST